MFFEEVQRELASESETFEFARQLAPLLRPGLVIYLQGDLGAGKTTFTRALLQAMGHKGSVKSPTFTLVEPYEIGTQAVFHCDLYRLGSPDELFALGFDEYCDGESICLIEWPEKAAGALPKADIILAFAYAKEGRTLCFSAKTEKGMNTVLKLQGQ